MYTLYRDGEGFGVRQDTTDMAVVSPELRPLTARRVASPRVAYNQWKSFVEEGRIRGRNPDPLLLESWERCRQLNVDPAPRSCWNFTPMNQIEPFTNLLREIASDVEQRTYAALKGKGLLLTITDAKGRVARTCGELEILKQADKLNFGPGANWAEKSVGTNAIGTALATGRPMQVFGQEHFCESHHAWNCTACPIFDARGELWGCFDISGPPDADHSMSFDLVLNAVRELEKRLFHMHMVEMEGKFCSLMSAAFNSVLTGVLSVGVDGRINSANGAAEALLGQSGQSLRGRFASNFLDFESFLARQKHDSPRAEPVELRCLTNPKVTARAAPVFSIDGQWCDTVITLTERQQCRSWTTPAALDNPSEPPKGFATILHRNNAMRETIQRAANAARTPSTVLLTGESGTGKELFARGIHQAGPKADGPFVAVNCGALSEELVQSELFGYCGGAFTGADKKGRIGKFEQANHGVLFLDEISEMPLNMQVNLLRALEEHRIVRVGGSTSRPVDVKVIAATNRDLAQHVADGAFREDLYYRINVVGIHIPALRERTDDVPLLAQHHARRLCSDFELPYAGIAPEVLDVLSRHDWPGNVRELINCMESAVNNAPEGYIRIEHLPRQLRDTPRPKETDMTPHTEQGGFRLDNVEAETIREALQHHNGNVSRTAKALGIGRNTLYAKMRRFSIDY